MARPMNAQKGFTLVELLVVISIIALLISILAPSLKSARELVKENFCKTNINALNKSVAVYSELNKGFMMVYKHDKPGYYLSAEGASGWGQVYKTFVAYKWDMSNVGNINPLYGTYYEPNGDAMGFGLVYSNKLLEPSEMFYCPSQTATKSTRAYYGYDHPWGGWLPDTDDVSGSDFIRISYMYNPWVVLDPSITKNVMYEDKLVLAKHPNDRFVTADLMTKKDNVSHMQGNIIKWNLGSADGHVSTISCKNTGNALTPRNLYSFFLRMDATGNDTESSWMVWGCNNAANTIPMGQKGTTNGSVRFELLNGSSGS